MNISRLLYETNNIIQDMLTISVGTKRRKSKKIEIIISPVFVIKNRLVYSLTLSHCAKTAIYSFILNIPFNSIQARLDK